MERFHLLRIAGVFGGLVALLPAADFTAPAEGPVAFRRDKTPLDTETIAQLSKQLETLARGMDVETAANRRCVAQMLALATALDPSNSAARELVSTLVEGSHQPKRDEEKVGKFHLKIWQYVSWLETSEAGSQGRALAACLSDVMAVSDPKHPKAEALRAAGERGAWARWVPPISAYETKAEGTGGDPKPEIGNPVAKILAHAQVFTTLWKKSEAVEPPTWGLTTAPIQMSTHKRTDDAGDPREFSITIHPNTEDSPLAELGPMLKGVLEKQHGPLPAGWEVVIASEELKQSLLSGKRQSLSAAVAVLASAAVTGREPDATILGVIDKNGGYKLPTGFWDQLGAIGKGTGGRLILPTAASEYLPSILALERPEFFLEHEVLLASNFQELLDLSAMVPDEATRKTSARFQEIREKAGSQSVGQYVANSFIRRRLADLALEAPNHFSAKMLAIQGAGNRPTLVTRKVLIPELRRAIEPMTWIVNQPELFSTTKDLPKPDRFNQSYETCQAQVEHMERYADKVDRELVEHVRNMLAAIRPLERAARTRGEEYEIIAAMAGALAPLVTAYEAVAAELAEPSPSP